jgi:NAD(P)-dependent dehydrogenase (short-subunit alcohol dehydrogenase family)
MHHHQHPAGTGFTAFATAADVMTGIDLTDRNAIVTGGHSGLGLVTTRALSEAGAWVTVAARDPQRAKRNVQGIRRVEVERLDLLDPWSIEAFTGRARRQGRPVDILVNNAGLPSAGGLQHDARGYEAQLAVNHLGHFQLTLGLLPVLLAGGGARVVTTSSGAHRMSDILWDDPHFRSGRHHPDLAYAQSKTANVLFTWSWTAGGARPVSAPTRRIPASSRPRRSTAARATRPAGRWV